MALCSRTTYAVHFSLCFYAKSTRGHIIKVLSFLILLGRTPCCKTPTAPPSYTNHPGSHFINGLWARNSNLVKMPLLLYKKCSVAHFAQLRCCYMCKFVIWLDHIYPIGVKNSQHIIMSSQTLYGTGSWCSSLPIVGRKMFCRKTCLVGLWIRSILRGKKVFPAQNRTN